MEGATPSNKQIGFGDNNKLPVKESGKIGAMRNVQVVDGMYVNLAGANKLAVDNKMPILLTDTTGFLMYPHSKVQIRQRDVAMTFPVVDGLYQLDTEEFWRVMGADTTAIGSNDSDGMESE